MTSKLNPPELSKYLRFLDKRIDLPKLYKKKDDSKYQYWEIYLELLNANKNVVKIKKEALSARLPKGCYSRITSCYGYIGGKIQETSVEITEGKNIGRSNETNVLSQGILEMTSKWTKRIDKDQYDTTTPTGMEAGIELSKKEGISDIRPMLLHKYSEKKSKVKFPACVQPKLDGVRMITHYDPKAKDFKFYSRTGKEYHNLNHIRLDLDKIEFLKQNPDIYLDGEAFSEELSFNDIVGIVRKTLDSDNRELQKEKFIKLFVFDIFDLKDLNMPFRDRYQLYTKLLKPSYLKHLVGVLCSNVDNHEEIREIHVENSKDYEGSVIRNFSGKYLLGKRSAEALKMKDFINEEFKIIGFKAGKGKSKDCVIFELETKYGKKFNAVPEGTFKEREDYLKRGNELIGKIATVRFFEYTDSDPKKATPRFPIIIGIRDYE